MYARYTTEDSLKANDELLKAQAKRAGMTLRQYKAAMSDPVSKYYNPILKDRSLGHPEITLEID